MAKSGLCREKVLATVVRLLETTLIRVGNSDYAKQNKSYRPDHAARPARQDCTARSCDSSSRVRAARPGSCMSRTGASRGWSRPARTYRASSSSSISTMTASGVRSTSADVNAYLREATGRDITAKDFRTWAGTVLAAIALKEFETLDQPPAAKKNVKAAIERGGRPARQHPDDLPQVLRPPRGRERLSGRYTHAGRSEEEVDAELRDELENLKPEEAALLVLLKSRLNRDLQSREQGDGTRAGEAVKETKSHKWAAESGRSNA